jgi:K+-sensing histidine kinase KdpD
MVAGYFVIVVLSGLRFSLRLVQATTVAAAVSYLSVNGYARWFVSADIIVPRYHQIQTLLALLIVGIVVGQIVRQVRQMATEYRERSATTPSGS